VPPRDTGRLADSIGADGTQLRMHGAIAWRELRRDPSRPIRWTRTMRRPFRELLERYLDRSVELLIGPPSVVLRCVVDLYVRVGAIVFDAPANIVEEE
jgi:hypothetical protein